VQRKEIAVTDYSDANAFRAILDGIKVPPGMTNSRDFVQFVKAQIGRPESEGLQQLTETINHHTSVLLEIINSLGDLDERLHKSGR
jgi:hypothetical protein